MGDANASSSEHFTVVSSSGQATGQLTEILSSSQVAVLSNIAPSPSIIGPNASASLNTFVTSGNIIPACSTVTLSTLNNLTSSSNAVSYHPSLSFHPSLGNPTVAYQSLVPHPNFVSHPNITSYSNLSCQSPVMTHPRPNSLPPSALTVLPSHATVMPFNSPNIVNTGHDLTMSVGQAPMLQVLHPPEQLSSHLAMNVQSLVSHSQQNASMKHSEMELIGSASTSWISENAANASKQLSPKGKTRPNQVKNSSSNHLEDGSCECFICSSATTVAAVSLSAVMPHSHAPLVVLLADVLGYVLTSSHTLHSKVVCSSCYRLLEVIDEVQNTQTKNKADVRRRFQLTVASKHLSYARSQQAGGRWLCRRCGVVSLSRGGSRKRAALATHRGRKRSLRWPGSSKGRLSRTKDPVRQGKGEVHDAKESKEVRRPAETVTVEPDMLVEDLTKIKCRTNASAPGDEQQSSSSINKPASVHTNGTIPTSNGHTPAAAAAAPPPPTAALPGGGSALLPIFDNDPALFAAGERLKVGVMRRAFLSRQCRYQCHYCSHACESAVTLKMHVRVVHMPLLVYDADEGHLANGEASGSRNTEEDLEGGKYRLRMGVRLQNVSTDPLSAKPFVCLFCEWAYKLESSLQSHYRDQHSPRKPFQCPRCPENFRRNLELTRHRLYRCPERAKGTKRLKKQ